MHVERRALIHVVASVKRASTGRYQVVMFSKVVAVRRCEWSPSLIKRQWEMEGESEEG